MAWPSIVGAAAEARFCLAPRLLNHGSKESPGIAPFLALLTTG
jgi:hypothetical protein